MPQPIPFGATFQISTQNANSQDTPALALLRDGRVAVAWRDFGAGSGDIKLQTVQSDGTKSGTEGTANLGTTGLQSAPAIAALSGGGFVVAWESYATDGSGDALYRTFRADGTSAMLADGAVAGTTGLQQDISVVGLKDNQFAIGWNEGNTAVSGLGNSSAAMLRAFDLTGALGNGLRLSGNWGGDYGPRLTSDGTQILAAWDDSSGPSTAQNGEDGIYSRILTAPLPTANFTDGGTRMDTGTFREATMDPDVALTGAGVAVVWDDATAQTDSRDVFLSLNGVVSRVNTTTGNDQKQAAIAALPDGGFVVVWTDLGNLTGSDIRARVYNAAGQPASDDFVVTEAGPATALVQFAPDVVALKDGRFMVCWGDSNSGQGISGRIFDARTKAIQFLGGVDGERIFGTKFATGDTLAGGGGGDTLNGMAGNDVLQGGPGRDVLDGGLGKDVADYADVKGNIEVTLNGAFYAAVRINGTVQDRIRNIEVVWGGTSDDLLTGDARANELLGHGGGDRLDGKAGLDRLTGGTGGDVFVFSTAAMATNRDVITDFTSGADQIALTASVFTALGPTLDAGEFVTGAAVDPDDHLIYNATTRVLFWDADGSGAGRAVALVALQAGATLTFGDLALI